MLKEQNSLEQIQLDQIQTKPHFFTTKTNYNNFGQHITGETSMNRMSVEQMSLEQKSLGPFFTLVLTEKAIFSQSQ